jgi:hypothetical protein
VDYVLLRYGVRKGFKSPSVRNPAADMEHGPGPPAASWPDLTPDLGEDGLVTKDKALKILRDAEQVAPCITDGISDIKEILAAYLRHDIRGALQIPTSTKRAHP